MADAPKSCKEAFEQAPVNFNKDAAKGLKAVYQFDLSGDGGGQWAILIDNDQCTVQEGKHPSPSITISMTAQDYLDLLSGKLNGQMAFMTGKLRIAGDLGLAIKLQTLFNS
ncbi:MAG: SCP2 sterol-binding domain-containing protein [Candidatus Binataceae bacterium]|jgi:putative sterol carrier protein